MGLEFEPIEDQLEIEIGASRLRTDGATVWDLDLAFKKPFRLSDSVELMPGLGPTWEHNSRVGSRSGPWGAQVVFDLFFWQTRKMGWFVEPGYGITLTDSHARFASITVGVFALLP